MVAIDRSILFIDTYRSIMIVRFASPVTRGFLSLLLSLSYMSLVSSRRKKTFGTGIVFALLFTFAFALGLLMLVLCIYINDCVSFWL